MADDRQITYVIGADLASLQAALSQAKGNLADFANSGKSSIAGFVADTQEKLDALQKKMDSFSETVKHVAEALLIFKTFEWGKEAVFSGTELAETLYRTAAITGISAQELQRLKYAADVTGSSFESVTRMIEFAGQALMRLRQSGEAGGGRVGTALRDLGLTEADLADTQNLLEKVAVGLEHVQGAAQRIGDMRALFGRMGAEQIPLLMALPELTEEFNKLGFAVTDAGIAKAWEAQETWNKLGSVMSFVSLQIGADLAPTLTALATVLIRVAGAFDAWLKSPAAAEFGKELTLKILNLIDALDDHLVPALKTAGTVLHDLGVIVETVAHPFNTLLDVLNSTTAAFERLTLGGVVTLKSLGKAAYDVATFKTYGVVGADLFGTVGASAEAAKPRVDELHKATDAIRKALEAPVDAKALDILKGAKPGGVPPGPPLTPAEIAKEIEERAKAAESKLAIDEAYNKQRLAFGQETATEEIKVEIALANQKFAIEDAALKQAAAIEGLKPAQHAAILALIKEQESKHQAEIIGLDTKLQEARNKLAQEGIADEIKANNIRLDYRKAQVDMDIALDKVSADEGERIKADLARQELEYEKGRLEQELALNNQSLEERRKIADQIRDLNAKMNLQILEDTKKALEAQRKEVQEVAKAWDTTFETLGHTMDSVINDALSGTQKLGDVFKKTMAEMVKSIIESGLVGLLVGGEKGSIVEGLFGTKGGGEAVTGGRGGILGLGGGLAGLFTGSKGLAGLFFGDAGATTLMSTAAGAGGGSAGGLLGWLFGGVMSFAKSLFGVGGGPSAAPGAAPAAGGGGAAGAVGTGASAVGTAAGLLSGGAQTALLTLISTELLTLTGAVITQTGGVILGDTTLGLILAGITTLNASMISLIAIDTAILVKPSALGFTFAQGGIVPSARGGMIAGGGVLAVLHPEEMVLPAPISRGVQNMVAATGGRGPGSTGLASGHQVTISYGNVSALDARGVAEILEKHATTISRIVVDQLGRQGGRYPAFGVG